MLRSSRIDLLYFSSSSAVSKSHYGCCWPKGEEGEQAWKGAAMAIPAACWPLAPPPLAACDLVLLPVGPLPSSMLWPLMSTSSKRAFPSTPEVPCDCYLLLPFPDIPALVPITELSVTGPLDVLWYLPPAAGLFGSCIPKYGVV